jgi:phenylacetate-CoA ligase
MIEMKTGKRVGGIVENAREISGVKDLILKTLLRLPNSFNTRIIKFNRSPKLIFGKRYGSYCGFLKANRGQFDNRSLLLSSVNRAISEVPYYRQRYGGKMIDSVEKFCDRIEPIDKETVLNHFDDFINPEIDTSKYDYGTTGGTSGKPLRLIAPKDRYVVELATMHSLWANTGYDFQPRAVIRNHRLPEDQTYRVNPVTKEFVFDGFRLSDSYFEKIYVACRRNNIQFVHCYPSAAYEFCCFLQRQELDKSFIRAFLCGSENIFDYQLDLIQGRLGIRLYSFYGHSEKLILAGYCQNTNLYHVEPTYGYFELVDENNLPIRERGKVGEMVGTGFHNPGMVLIRYRTGDFAEYAGDYCPSCKRHVTLLNKIRGRWNGDKLFNADGTYLTTTALNLHSDLYSVINGIQYIQEKKGEIRILIIKAPQYEKRHEKALYRHFGEKFKPETEIQFEYVERLRKLPNGKFVHIISTVKD